MAEPLKQGEVLRLEAAKGSPSADRSLEMLAEKGLLTVFVGESWRSFSWEQWDALHTVGTRLLAGDQGRKAVELATAAGGLALFPLAADVEEALEEPTSLDEMTDARWARVLRALRHADECEADDAYPALRAFWDAAGKALEEGITVAEPLNEEKALPWADGTIQALAHLLAGTLRDGIPDVGKLAGRSAVELAGGLDLGRAPTLAEAEAALRTALGMPPREGLPDCNACGQSLGITADGLCASCAATVMLGTILHPEQALGLEDDDEDDDWDDEEDYEDE